MDRYLIYIIPLGRVRLVQMGKYININYTDLTYRVRIIIGGNRVMQISILKPRIEHI